MFNRFSNLLTLQKVISYCLKFSRNCGLIFNKRKYYKFSIQELKDGLNTLNRNAQHVYNKEMCASYNKRQISENSKLIYLDPCLDEDNILRVGGRLKNASISFDQRHSIILPLLTNSIIKHKHLHLLAGVHTLLSIIRQEFWPINGKKTL